MKGNKTMCKNDLKITQKEIQIISPDSRFLKILDEVLKQNDMILTQNIMIVRNITNPKYLVNLKKEKQ